MKSMKARTLVTSIEFRILTTNMYTIIVGDFLGWQTFSYFAKTIEIFLESVFFNVKCVCFHQKIMKFQ